jgi:putative tricarboxylic transport membrane protein
MTRPDYRDVIAGGLLSGTGLIAAGVASTNYDVGSFAHMGPGMFPTLVGLLLAGVGLLVLVPALARVGPPLPQPDYRPFLFVLIALAVFGFTIQSFGLIPAIVLLTIASVLADNKIGVIGTIILALALAAIAELIFGIALEIPLDAFKWPFQ